MLKANSATKVEAFLPWGDETLGLATGDHINPPYFDALTCFPAALALARSVLGCQVNGKPGDI